MTRIRLQEEDICQHRGMAKENKAITEIIYVNYIKSSNVYLKFVNIW
jgi:hypothetical protein